MLGLKLNHVSKREPRWAIISNKSTIHDLTSYRVVNDAPNINLREGLQLYHGYLGN